MLHIILSPQRNTLV